jgi:ABC-type lipopolysaccharide export system ATPase subunit
LLAAEAIREHIAGASQTKGIILTDHTFREVYKIANRLVLLDDCCLKNIETTGALGVYEYEYEYE